MLTEEKITALREKYGRIRHVEYNGVDLVFRKPSMAECDQHALSIEEGGAQKTFADRLMSQQTIVVCGTAEGEQPARAAWLDILKEYPYAWRSASIGGALSELTGVVQDKERKS